MLDVEIYQLLNHMSNETKDKITMFFWEKCMLKISFWGNYKAFFLNNLLMKLYFLKMKERNKEKEEGRKDERKEERREGNKERARD